jgi:hypothetical protein
MVMAADHLIAARVSADTKARLRALAAQQGLTESAILKRLLDSALAASGPTSTPVIATPDTTRLGRLYVRLHPDDRSEAPDSLR